MLLLPLLPNTNERARARTNREHNVNKCGNWNFYSKQCPCCNRYVNNNKTHSHSRAVIETLTYDRSRKEREREGMKERESAISWLFQLTFPIGIREWLVRDDPNKISAQLYASLLRGSFCPPPTPHQAKQNPPPPTSVAHYE